MLPLLPQTLFPLLTPIVHGGRQTIKKAHTACLYQQTPLRNL